MTIKIIWKTVLILMFFIIGFLSTVLIVAKINHQNQSTELADIKLYDMSNVLTADELRVVFYSLDKKKKMILSENQHRITFLNFWATWCAPCIAEMPHIVKLKKHFADKNIDFIIASDENKVLQKKFIEKKKIPLDFYSYRRLSTVFEGNILPRTYILYDGKVHFTHVGRYDFYNKNIITLIDTLTQKARKENIAD